MAHSDDAATYADLLARLDNDGTRELFRQPLERALQDLVDAELTAQIGRRRGGHHSGRPAAPKSSRARRRCSSRRTSRRRFHVSSRKPGSLVTTSCASSRARSPWPNP